MISAWKRYAVYIALSFVILGAMEYARADAPLETPRQAAVGVR
ncbi:hypothetical protein ABE957_10780 [Halomonas sp. CS7]|uniref:Uncharacterized protein n=1 Tax=Halomonas pelophila TaxID=3151122 RepID=A0ABV1N5Z0_9GAMM